MRALVKYNVNPQLELDCRLVVSEMTGLGHEEIKALSWSVQHEDEVESKINIDFKINDQDFAYSVHSVNELREWLKDAL